MRYSIICPNNLLNDKEIASLIKKYEKRIKADVEFIELKCKTSSSDTPNIIIEKQGNAIQDWLLKHKSVYSYVLDERGKNIDSPSFSKQIQSQNIDGFSHFVFIIGGAYGLCQKIVTKANQPIAFGKMVWPHRLVGLMLIEQLYRAETIISGHPYHK
jgi:23S rRNA (pseudouridine1915-N3)-methyltransferase